VYGTALTQCSEIDARCICSDWLRIVGECLGVLQVEAWSNLWVVRREGCGGSQQCFRSHYSIDGWPTSCWAIPVKCLDDAIEVARIVWLKKCIADGVRAVDESWRTGREAFEERTRFYSASFVYIYNLLSTIMVPKIRHPGVSSYFQLLIRVLPVSGDYRNSKSSCYPGKHHAELLLYPW
jgi:hypothetical protein